MKFRLFIFVVFVSSFFPLPSLYADSALGESISHLATDFSLQFRDRYPDLVFRPNLAILDISNMSGEAEEYELGRTLALLLELNLQRSTIFNLVDESQRAALLKEISFSLSGLSDTERLQPGRLETIDYYLDGTVSSVGDNFLLFLRAIEVNSGSVIYTGSTGIDKQLLIERSIEFSTAYVAQYGLGLEFHVTPFFYFDGETARIEGQPGEAMLLGLDFNYRITRSLFTWVSLEVSGGGFRFEKSEEDSSGGGWGTWQNITINEDLEVAPSDIPTYRKDRTYTAASLGAGYVFNLSRAFNITLGAQVKVEMIYLIQEYKMPNVNTYDNGQVGEAQSVSNMIYSSDASSILAGPVVKLQYFITPRLAAHMRYSYLRQLSEKKASQFIHADVHAGEDDGLAVLFGLDPFADIEGRKHSYDFSGHRVSFGLGFYF